MYDVFKLNLPYLGRVRNVDGETTAGAARIIFSMRSGVEGSTFISLRKLASAVLLVYGAAGVCPWATLDTKSTRQKETSEVLRKDVRREAFTLAPS